MTETPVERRRFAGRLAGSNALVRIDPVADPAWSELLERASSATIFHHPGWLRLLRDHYGYPVSAWCLPGDGGRLVTGLPVALVRGRITGSRLISLPFSDACPPLHDPAGGLEPHALVTAVSHERRRAGLALEVRSELPGAPRESVGERYAQHLLSLEPDVDGVRRRFAKSQVKRGIAKAIREGVTIERGEDRGALDRFYAMHMATRREQGVPTQPRRFILRFAELFEAGLGVF